MPLAEIWVYKPLSGKGNPNTNWDMGRKFCKMNPPELSRLWVTIAVGH